MTRVRDDDDRAGADRGRRELTSALGSVERIVLAPDERHGGGDAAEMGLDQETRFDQVAQAETPNRSEAPDEREPGADIPPSGERLEPEQLVGKPLRVRHDQSLPE